MGLSKKDIGRRRANLKAKLEELEKRAKMDPMKRDTRLHEELEMVRRKLSEAD